MLTDRIPILRWLFVNYTPSEGERAFLERKQTQTQNDVDVSVAVLDSRESHRFFGVKMARRAVQPVWLHVVNRSDRPQRLSLLSVDPNYYSPLEAAAANHFSTG